MQGLSFIFLKIKVKISRANNNSGYLFWNCPSKLTRHDKTQKNVCTENPRPKYDMTWTTPFFNTDKNFKAVAFIPILTAEKLKKKKYFIYIYIHTYILSFLGRVNWIPVTWHQFIDLLKSTDFVKSFINKIITPFFPLKMVIY